MVLLRENILFSLAKKVVVMAGKTKFEKFFRTFQWNSPTCKDFSQNNITKLGGNAQIRTLERGYPTFQKWKHNLDCDFGTIKNPKTLSQKIKQIPGVLESGIFLRKPDIIYKAKTGGKFDIL